MSSQSGTENEAGSINQEELPMISKMNLALLGARTVFDLHTLGFLSDNKKEYPMHLKEIESCEKTFRMSIFSCIALSGALALSMRRYFPSFFSSFSLKSAAVDLGIGAIGMSCGLHYASNKIQNDLNKVISELILDHDKNLISSI